MVSTSPLSSLSFLFSGEWGANWTCQFWSSLVNANNVAWSGAMSTVRTRGCWTFMPPSWSQKHWQIGQKYAHQWPAGHNFVGLSLCSSCSYFYKGADTRKKKEKRKEDLIIHYRNMIIFPIQSPAHNLSQLVCLCAKCKCMSEKTCCN